MTSGAGWVRGRLRRLVSVITMERLIDPILTDMEIERQAAERDGRTWKTRWILAMGLVGLLRALALHGGQRFWTFREWPSGDRRAFGRTLGYAAAVTGAAILMLMAPPLARFPPHTLQSAVTLGIYLIPQALPLAMPIGLLLGVLYGLRDAVSAGRAAVAVLVVATLCSIGSFATLAWILPESNQAFRVAAMADPRIERGYNELALDELRRRIAARRAEQRDVPVVALNYYQRWSLAAAPAVFGLWGLLLIARVPNRRWVLGVTALASCVGYYALMDAGRFAVLREALPPMAGAWIPNAAFVAAALLLVARRTSSAERRTAL
jgi:hypothetical protein